MYVIIIGGGKVGYYLTKELLKQRYEVLLLEKDKRRLEFLTKEFGDMVIHGDGCEIRCMDQCGFQRADVVVAVTGDDEDNLVICQMAQQRFNVPRVLTRVNDPANEPIFHKLGIKETLNSTRLIYNLIEQRIESDEIVPLAALQQGNIELVEVHIGENSPVTGKRIVDLGLPDETKIIAIVHDNHSHIPSFETRLEADDTVLALVQGNSAHKLAEIFGS